MLVFQYFILLYNYMIVMLNELNLFVYICNDFDQNKLVQSDIIICIILLYIQIYVLKLLRIEVLYIMYIESCN